jgi:hypothetical protein
MTREAGFRLPDIARELGLLEWPTARVRPHIGDRGAQGIEIRFGNAERDELIVAILHMAAGLRS